MADFHALITQALKTKNSDDPAERQAVYQSSRNALVRMLDKSGNGQTEAGKQLFSALEASISKIEAEYLPILVEPNIAPQTNPVLLSGADPIHEQVSPQINVQTDTLNPIPQVSTPPQGGVSPAFTNTAQAAPPVSQMPPIASPQVSQDNIDQNSDQFPGHHAQPHLNVEVGQGGQINAGEPTQPPLNYKRKSPWLRGLSSLLIILIILGVILWLAYAFVTSLSENATQASQTQKKNEIEQKSPDSNYIELLSPSDPSALITSGRGSAEVVTELNVDYLRIQSIRSSPNSASVADPILLELKPGVLQQIAGKQVTVEFKTKSGTNMDGLFSVQCIVAGKSVCDRKRFPVGQQPENVIFALRLDKSAVNGNAFLAINTDVKSASNPDGFGHPIDILHVRMRVPK